MSDTFKTLFAPLIALLGGTAIAAIIAFYANTSLERDKFSYAVIQNALAAETPEERIERLKLLIRLKILSDPDLIKALEKEIASPKSLPQLVSSGYNVSNLRVYKIKIFYTQENVAQRDEANLLASKIKGKLPGVEVEVAIAKDSATDDQIRYERGREDLAAVGLQQLLKEVHPQRPFRNQTVVTQTTNFLSVFLKTER